MTLQKPQTDRRLLRRFKLEGAAAIERRVTVVSMSRNAGQKQINA